MSGFAPAAVALLALLGKVDIDGIVVNETRAGEAPLVANQEPRATFVEVFTPVVVLHLLDHGLEIRLDYAPRVFWLAATNARATRPLVLNVVDLAATVQTSARLKITGKANFSKGTADYTYLTQLLGPAQATQPTAIDVLSLTAGEITELRLDPTWTLIVEADAAYRRPSGNNTVTTNAAGVAPMTTIIPFPRQKGVQVIPTASDRLSAANDLVLSSGVSLQSTSSITETVPGVVPTTAVGDFEVLTVSPEVGWRTRPAPGRELHLGAGVAYNHLIKTPYNGVPVSPVSPLVNIDYSVNVMTAHESAYRGTVSAAVDYFVNPVIATAGPRGLVGGAFYYAVPEWMLGLEGTFATPIGTRSLAEWQFANPGTPPPDETVASLSLPLRHRVSQNFIAEVGGRWADRGPRLSSDFAFHQRQLWVYVTLTATSVPVRSSLAP